MGSDHPPILLTVPLSPLYCPNKRPPSFNFRKARWDDFAFYVDSRCPSAEEILVSFPFLCCCSLYFSGTECGQSSIPFGRIKRQPQAWWSSEVEEAVSERYKAFAAAHRRDKDRQVYTSASRHASIVIAKAKAEA